MPDNEKSRRWWVTPCGLNCSYCPVHLRAKEELDYYRERNVDPEKVRCDGCRSDRKGHHWLPDCEILKCCVYDRKLEFCCQCPDFPCPALEEWGREYEHHGWAVENLKKMKELGIDKWMEERNNKRKE